MRYLIIAVMSFSFIPKVKAAAGDWNIPVRNIGNSSINTFIPKINTWGLIINNPTAPNTVVPGTFGFPQLVPFTNNFELNGSGQFDLSSTFFTWLETDYVPRAEVLDLIDAVETTPGPQGVQGEQGIQGETGPKGDTGNTGAQGIQGIQGEIGPKGDTGDQGIQGLTGPQGVKGDTGNQGPKGDTGDVGSTGSQGIQGVKGDKGDIGNTGSTGNTGAQGPKGDKGDTGDTGPQGNQGVQGPSGTNGTNGTNGSSSNVIAGSGIAVTGTFPNFVVSRSKKQETFSGITNASGQYTVTFGTTYSVAPNIQANLINGADNQNIRITSITTTGFTVLARTRVDVIGLLPTWNNATSVAVDVIVTEK